MENKSFLEKALVKAEKAMEATPEYHTYIKAESAYRRMPTSECLLERKGGTKQ